MAADKYSAVWISHSSINNFLRCPRAYYFNSIYKDPVTGKRITIAGSALSLGLAVHNTVEPLKEIRTEERDLDGLRDKYEKEWKKFSGKKGGFKDADEEAAAKERGRIMIERVIANPGPLVQKTVPLRKTQNNMPQNFFISEEDGIILCGNIDWIEYVPEDDSIKVIDFKTGKHDEGEDSLQLPIYLLLLNEIQKRRVSGAAYWYLDRDDGYVEKKLPDAEDARAKVLEIGLQMKKARADKAFECHSGEKGCYNCRPFDAILRGEGEVVGTNESGGPIYFLS